MGLVLVPVALFCKVLPRPVSLPLLITSIAFSFPTPIELSRVYLNLLFLLLTLRSSCQLLMRLILIIYLVRLCLQILSSSLKVAVRLLTLSLRRVMLVSLMHLLLSLVITNLIHSLNLILLSRIFQERIGLGIEMLLMLDALFSRCRRVMQGMQVRFLFLNLIGLRLC